MVGVKLTFAELEFLLAEASTDTRWRLHLQHPAEEVAGIRAAGLASLVARDLAVGSGDAHSVDSRLQGLIDGIAKAERWVEIVLAASSDDAGAVQVCETADSHIVAAPQPLGVIEFAQFERAGSLADVTETVVRGLLERTHGAAFVRTSSTDNSGLMLASIDGNEEVRVGIASDASFDPQPAALDAAIAELRQFVS